MDGHPTIFMKILHFAVFYASSNVKNFLYSHEVDPDTIHLNDFKFMEKMYYICTNLLGVKPRVNIEQFFKYGFAEQKMMTCVDVITRVREMNRELRIKASLNSTRRKVVRSISSSPRLNNSALKFKSQTLAELQEDMRQDF